MLEVRDLHVNYGSTTALRGVTLSVPESAAVALLGSNGAGKTTLLRAVSGTLSLHRGGVRAGDIFWLGKSFKGQEPARIVRAGVVQVPEGRRVFGRLTIDENLKAGAFTSRDRQKVAQTRERVLSMFPVLEKRLSRPAGLLSGGEQQMLAISRALMSEPRLLMLDEPSLGLAPLVMRQIAQTIKEINSGGTSVLIVEQNAAIALQLAQSAYVLHLGRVSLEGPADELAESDQIKRLYLGQGLDDEDAASPSQERDGAVVSEERTR